jgi:Recombination endonuclease VII
MSNENEQTVNSKEFNTVNLKKDLKKCGGLRGKKSCGQWLPLDAFGKNKSKPDGKQHTCLKCEAIRVEKYRNGNPKYRETARIQSAAYTRKHPDKNLASVVKHRYGITPQQRSEIAEAQGNACARCRTPFSNGRPCMDHDHSCCPGERSCGLCLRAVPCLACNFKLTVKYCRANQHTDSYLVRYAVRRVAKEQGVDSALESLLLAIAEDPSESNAVRIRARETGAMLQRVERPVAA